MVLVVLLWVFLVPGHWPRTIVVLAVFIALAVTSAKLHGHYERTGRAVRIPRSTTAVKFPKGMPRPMLAVRAVFFVLAGIMLLLGVVPLKNSVARDGIVACVVGLIVIAGLNLGLEYHYVRNGDATEVTTDL